MFNWDTIKYEIIEGNFSLGSYVTVAINGKQYKRKVYNCKDDLYIIVKGYKFYFMDFIKGEDNE